MRLGAPAVAVLVAVATASCGGGGGPKRLSPAQFQHRAGRICRRYHDRLAALGTPTTLDSIAKIARGAAGLGRKERRQLKRLVPPEQSAEDFRQMLRRLAAADALLPEVHVAATAGRAKRVQALAEKGQKLVAEANRHAVALRLRECRRT